MRRCTLLIGVIVCAGVVATAAAGGDSDPATGGEKTLSPAGQQEAAIDVIQEAKDRFRSENSRARLYQNGPRVTRVYGSAFGFGTDPHDTAEQFKTNHADIFGVRADDLLPVSRVHDSGNTQGVMYNHETGEYKFTLVYYSQSKDGIPVFRSDLRLLTRNAPDHPLVLVSSGLRPLGDFEAEAQLRANLERKEFTSDVFSAAKEEALTVIPDLVHYTEPTVVIWAGLDDMEVEPRVALSFIADNFGLGGNYDRKWLFLTDAETGEILYDENVLIDVDGNASGNSTEGVGADFCENEVPMAMPHLAVTSGASSTFTDANGDFSISGGITVEATLADGQYFDIFQFAPGPDVESLSVAAGPVVNLLFNAANTDEEVRAQTNGYVHANVVRDFAAYHNPSYPTFTDTDIPCTVNRTDGYCPGNAWYDPSDFSSPTGYSINFCESGDGYPNTAWSSVIYHEFGHHLVNAAGSGQDQYGEGAGDCMSAIILDDSRLGFGFFGTCDEAGTLRSADNTIQYPCSGTIHYCGQLLSGCIWDTRNELVVTEPADYQDILGNLMVNSILLHTGSSITPQITIDWLTLDDTDGNIYNGTPHATEICVGFGAHNMDDVCDSITFSPIGFEYPDGRPEAVPPGQVTTFLVNVVPLTGAPTPGTGTISYRINEGSFTTDPMNEINPNEYEATLPAADCFETIEYYISADAAGEGTITDPVNAPSSIFSALVSTGTATVVEDDFETDQGWTVQDTSVDEGSWERGVPSGSGGSRGDPPSDSDGSGNCYITGNGFDEDLDGGPTRLLSPVLDLADGEAYTISYARWLRSYNGTIDQMVVEISNNDGGSWTTVETVSDGSGWAGHSFNVGDYVEPTALVRVRFIVNDNPNDSVTEGGLDAFVVSAVVCEETCIADGDMDGSGSTNGGDIQLFVDGLTGTLSWEIECRGDFAAPFGTLDLNDIDGMVSVLLAP